MVHKRYSQSCGSQQNLSQLLTLYVVFLSPLFTAVNILLLAPFHFFLLIVLFLVIITLFVFLLRFLRTIRLLRSLQTDEKTKQRKQYFASLIGPLFTL